MQRKKEVLWSLMWGFLIADANNLEAQLLPAEQHDDAQVEIALKGLVQQGAATATEVQKAKRDLRNRLKRIVNGTPSASYPAAGALLHGADHRSATLYCSGTMISCNTFLTAAHCFKSDYVAKNYKVFFQHAGFFDVKEFEPHPKADIAVVKLARDVEAIVPMPINRKLRPANGSHALIVGFGRTGGKNEDYGIKRLGSVKTVSCKATLSNAELICWNYDARIKNPGYDSNTCNSDSGGGLYMGSEGVVVGTTISGTREDCLAGDHSVNSNVFKYHAWIDGFQKDGVTAKACGTPTAISPNRHVLAKTEQLGVARPLVQYDIDVPSGTAQLRVGMNGEDTLRGDVDFDLYVMQHRTGDTSQAVCAEDGPGQFAYCEVQNPTPGAWTIVVKRKKGEGFVQTAVTLIPSEGER